MQWVGSYQSRGKYWRIIIMCLTAWAQTRHVDRSRWVWWRTWVVIIICWTIQTRRIDRSIRVWWRTWVLCRRRSPQSCTASNPANRQKAPGLPGGCGAKPHVFFSPFSFFVIFEKNDPILSKIHLRNHNKKETKLCSIAIEHIEIISEWSIQI